MYKDLITQIAKYLKPKSRYSLLLEIERDCNGTVRYTFYLIYKLNDKIEMKYTINKVAFPFTIVYHTIENYLMMAINTSPLYIKPYIFIYLNRTKFIVAKSYQCWDYFNIDFYPDEGKEFIKHFEKQNHCSNKNNCNFCNLMIDSFEINKKSFESIRKGIKIFEKISKISNLKNEDLTEEDLKNEDFTEEEKKYVKIYEHN